MASTEQVTAVVNDLIRIFGERDASKRQELLSKIFAPSPMFIDATNFCRTLEGINDLVSSLEKPGFVVSEREPVVIMKAANGEDVSVARLRWAYGLPGEKPAATGEDILTIVNGKIERLYGFVDGQ